MERLPFAVTEGKNLEFSVWNPYPIIKSVGETTEQTAPHIFVNCAPAQRKLSQIGHGFINRDDESAPRPGRWAS